MTRKTTKSTAVAEDVKLHLLQTIKAAVKLERDRDAALTEDDAITAIWSTLIEQNQQDVLSQAGLGSVADAVAALKSDG